MERPVLLVPASCFSYLHGPRELRAGGPMERAAVPGPAGRTMVNVLGGREMAVEAAFPWVTNKKTIQATCSSWFIERLALPDACVNAADQHRQLAHQGLP